MNSSLSESDIEIYNLLKWEEKRQWEGLELIASENFTSQAVMEVLGSAFTNKYSEGLPGKRYYGGNQFIDQLETLCISRCLQAFDLNPNVWGVNVQPYSGSIANFAVYTALLQPHDRIMGLDLPSGGHLTHGYYTAKKKISATSIFFESLPYQVDLSTGRIDYDQLHRQAHLFRPKMIICGGSAYPREWDYQRLRTIADSVGAYLFTDMAHVAGLIAGGELESPFKHSHVVTTTTHKTLRGPRAGLIFYHKDLEEKVDFAVFPTIQGGPHNNTIAAIAVQMKEVCSPEFKKYASQVIKNSRTLAKYLMDKDYKLVTDGTDNHLILWDLRPLGLSGSKMQSICDCVAITLNKNSIPGDVSAINPGGVRIGTPALTSRGLVERDFIQIGEYLDRTVDLAIKINKQNMSLQEFKNRISGESEMANLRTEIENFSKRFFMPGFDI